MIKPCALPFIISLCLLLLLSCASTPQKESLGVTASSTNSSAFTAQFNKTLKQINAGQQKKASESLNLLTSMAASPNEQAQATLVSAIFQDARGQSQQALDTLIAPEPLALLNQADNQTKKQINELLAKLYEKTARPIVAAKQRVNNSRYYTPQSEAYQNNHQQIWKDLNKASKDDIQLAYDQADQGIYKDWLSLALATHDRNESFKTQIDHINDWIKQHPIHPAAMIPPAELTGLRTAYRKIPQKVAVILPFEGRYKSVSNAIRDGIMHNYYDQKISDIHFYNVDPSGSFMEVYQDAVHNGAELVIGPLLKDHLKELTSQSSLPVKTVALNANRDTPIHTKNLIQFSLGSEDEIDSLIDLAQKEHHQRALVLAENSDWAKQNMAYFKQHWEAKGNKIVDTATFTSTQSQSTIIRDLLDVHLSDKRRKSLENTTGLDLESEPRRRQDIDMVVFFAKPNHALAIPPLFSFYYASDLPIYSTSSIFRGYNESKTNQDLNGVKITEFPIVINRGKDIPGKYAHSPLIRMFAFGKDAFALGERAPSFDAFSQVAIQGATGTLTLKNQTVHRQTQPAVFKSGVLKPLQVAHSL